MRNTPVEGWQSWTIAAALKAVGGVSSTLRGFEAHPLRNFRGRGTRHGVEMKAYSATLVKENAPVKREKKPVEQVLCAMPCEAINHTLEMELEAGDVVLTRAAQIHARRRHPEEFEICLPHLAAVVANPLYVGDDAKNPGIELISRIPAAGGFILVAVKVEPDAQGRYEVASFYPVSEQKIAGRRDKGFLKIAQKPKP